MRDDCRIATRRVGSRVRADRDGRPSSLRAPTVLRGAARPHGHGVRMVMGQCRCAFRPACVPERRFARRNGAVLACGAMGAVRDSTQYFAALAPGATAHLGARRRIRRPGVLSRRCGAGGRSFQRSDCSARRNRNRLGVHLALVGAFAGPASFRAGAALGAVHFNDPTAALVVIATGWAFILPAALAIARHWDGVTPLSPPTIGADVMNDARAE